MQFPRINTNRLCLRELELFDKEALFRIFSDPEVTRFYNVNAFHSIEDSLALIERRKNRFVKDRGIHWGITFREDEKTLIGCCGFNALNFLRCNGEIGYELERPFWNQGIMTEALQAVLSYGFDYKMLNSVEAWVMPGNHASARVLTKLGFETKGVQEGKGYWNGRFHDLEQFYLHASKKQRLPAFEISFCSSQ